MDTCSWSWDLGFAVSSLSLASLLSGLFPEAQPIYLLTLSLIQDPLIYKPAAQKGMPLLHKYTERDREKENDNVILTHSLSFWEVGHPPRIQSTITNKSFSYCFSDQIWSPNNRLFSSTFCTSKWRRESPEETERVREGGRNTPASQIYPVRTCERPVWSGHRDWASWSSRSYNTVDKKPRAQPSGNPRGEASRAGKNQAAAKHLRYITPVLAHIPLKTSVLTFQPEENVFLRFWDSQWTSSSKEWKQLWERKTQQ